MLWDGERCWEPARSGGLWTAAPELEPGPVPASLNHLLCPCPAHASVPQGSLGPKPLISLLLLPANWPEWVCRAGSKVGLEERFLLFQRGIPTDPPQQEKTKPICEVDS